MKKILVAGSSNMDLVVRVADMPKKGETIRSHSYKQIPGGKGANQACACGKLGGDCTFLSVVGQDGMGQALIESLQSAGVDTRFMVRHTEPTGIAIITVSGDGDNSIVIVPGANGKCDAAYIEGNRQQIAEADFVVTQLETPEEGVYDLLQWAKENNKVTVLNPAPAPDSIPEDVLQGLDYITPNETELEKLTGIPTDTLDGIEKAARKLLSQGVGNVLVTIGAQGAFLCNREMAKVFPTITVKPVDTTAAGDTFNAGFVVALSQDRTLEEAIAFANAAASISTTRPGAQPSIPTADEVETALKGWK